MNKFKWYITFFLTVLLITACSKDDTDDDEIALAWKLQNEQALSDLAKDPDYTKLESLSNKGNFYYYRVIQKGNGKRVFYNSRAEVYYKGWFVATNADKKIKKGDVFDRKLFDDGTPFKVGLSSEAVSTTLGYSSFIKGWTEVLQHMVVGDKWEVWIPYQFAYGEKGSGSIPGYSALAYEIEVVKAIDISDF